MLGSHLENFQELWVPKNGKKQPKLALIGWNEILETIVTPKYVENIISWCISMLGIHLKNLQKLWVSKNSQKQPKIAQIGLYWVKWDSGDNCNPKICVKYYILMYFNVRYPFEKSSKTLGIQKWPKTAQNSTNWPYLGEMRFWSEL